MFLYYIYFSTSVTDTEFFLHIQDTWPHGYSLINYMKIVEMKGLTNVIKFDHQGFRTDFILDIVELNPTGLKLVGNWNSSQGVNFTKTYGEHQKEIVENLKNKTLIVTTILVSQNDYFL